MLVSYTHFVAYALAEHGLFKTHCPIVLSSSSSNSERMHEWVGEDLMTVALSCVLHRFYCLTSFAPWHILV